MRDIINNIGVKQAIAPAVQASTINGTGIDTLGFGSLSFVFNIGAIVGAGDFGVKLQDSDDNATYADVIAAQVQGLVPATLLTGAVYKLGYLGFKRYARAVATKAGGTSIALDAIAVLGRAVTKPVA